MPNNTYVIIQIAFNVLNFSVKIFIKKNLKEAEFEIENIKGL